MLNEKHDTAGKSLSQRIAERVIRNNAPSSPAVHRAIVVIHKREILEAIDRGCSLLSIWTTLRAEGVVDFGYQAFSRHVKNIAQGIDRSEANN